jgi:hypothetical protein
MEHWVAQDELCRQTGMVIPAYFSAKPPDEMIRQLLWMTLADCRHYLPLTNVWVVVDGDARTARLVEELRAQMERDHGATFRVLALPENRGKLGVFRAGIPALLAAQPDLQFVAVRDGDGDHAMSDLPTLLRLAQHLCVVQGDTQVLAIGARLSRSRPMGWVRGELEALLDQLTLDALAYALARQGRALDLSQCRGQGVPDLSSGYKVYGRRSAEALFLHHAPRLLTLSEHDYWHFGPETVTIIEGLLDGLLIGEATRTTLDGQPTTSFGEFRHVALYGELLAWVYARLEIPLAVAAQLYDNLIPPLPLRTSAPGAETLAQLRTYALEKVRAFCGETAPLPAARATVPFL